ncbi:MAG: GntR family transcriptional regulator [Hyphomicrobiales bacterium]|nr:MAG: GntR family transcriptional regulator [Hyphomicrobiales bacterium]
MTRAATSRATSTVPLVDEITAVIRERIYSNHYAPGARLRQEHLCQELGISRTPLREAFRTLEQEGLIRTEPGKGARVVTGDIDTLIAAYQLRAVVDGLAARLVAESPHHTRTRELRQAIALQVRAIDPWDAQQYSNCNVAFHERITDLTGNEFVRGETSLIRMTAQVFTPVAVVERDSAVRAIDEHKEILEAIEAGDGPRAERLARNHIEHTIAELRERYDR